MAKLLFFDIETSPNIVYSWTVGHKVNLSFDNIVKERQIICICYKWANQKTVHTLDWGKKQDDKALLKAFSKILLDADIAIAHNGDKYDIRFINGRLAFHNLDPVGEVTTVDTLKQSRKVFFINSHRLDYLGEFFQLGRKLDTGFGLWKRVMDGDDKALAKMIRYCKQDVKLLEKVYYKIRKYAPQRIHMGMVENSNNGACPSCGSSDAINYGRRIVSTIWYRRKQCKSCGHIFRSNERIKV